jgi:hypothetical protein
MSDQGQKFLRRSEAAAYLQSRYGAYSTDTLAKLASVGGGPPFRRLGKFPLYLKVDLDEWAMSRLGDPVRSTAEYFARKQIPSKAAESVEATVEQNSSPPVGQPDWDRINKSATVKGGRK